MLKDKNIRESLYEIIQTQNCKTEYRIIPEMAICDGLARADVTVANGKLCGYEIKSDADSLIRLTSQQLYYDKTFDSVSIVIGKKFETFIENVVPEWWGILIATERKNGKVKITRERAAKDNPNVSVEALLELLWHQEIKELLKSNGFKGLSGKNRRVLRQIACDNLSFKTIRNFTRETLKNRIEWRSEYKLYRPVI